MAEEVKTITLAEREHPQYKDNDDLWELYDDATKGGEDFINDENLFSHRLEDPEDFEERLDRAYYLNYCRTIPKLYNAFIFKENIERSPDDELERFRANADGRGTKLTDFIKRMGFFSKVFGAMHVLVDMPASDAEGPRTRMEVRDGTAYPYCVPIFPLQLKDWSMDANGDYNWILIESTYYHDQDPTVERRAETHYKLITKESWRIEDEDGNLVQFEDDSPAEGVNELGYVPLVTLYHEDLDDDKIGDSMLKDIVYINRIIMNWCSCIDEQVERQTFSQLIVPDDGTLAEESETGDDPLRKLVTSSSWTFNANATHPPAFISPDVANIQTIWSLVVDHIKEIYRLAGLVGASEDMYVSRSGRAAQMGFLSVNSALAQTANSYQQFENTLSKVALAQLGEDIEDFEEVKYPDSFDVEGLSEEIDAHFKVLEKNFSETLNKTMIKNVARKAVPLAPQSIREDIEKEIDEGNGHVEPSGPSFGADAEKDGDGNPNTDNLQDTFRTNEQHKREERTHRKE